MSTQLTLPAGIDGARLLKAIALQETAGGANNCPRFEAAYIPKGQAFTVQGRIVRGTGAAWNATVQSRWMMWGLASSASFSRWQILFHTAADLGFLGHPASLWVDSVAQEFVIKRLNQIAKGPATETVEQFADAWNSGSYRDSYEPKDYMRELSAHYDALGAP